MYKFSKFSVSYTSKISTIKWLLIHFILYCNISENISRVEHILVLLQQAGYEYEELLNVSEKVKQLLQEPSLDQQERESLQEIDSDIDNRIPIAVEAAFEN